MRIAIILFFFVNGTILEIVKDPKSNDENFGKTKYTQCSVKTGNQLPVLNSNFASKIKGSIFFIDPSCAGDLTARQACSVEAAATAHPKRTIVVLFVAPVLYETLHKASLRPLLRLPNVVLFSINVDDFVRETPIESLFKKVLNETDFSVNDLSHFLRFLTLYKYGGIYLDFDVLTLKSFSKLPESNNWIAMEDASNQTIGSSQMAISNNIIGRQFISHIFTIFPIIEYDPKSSTDYSSIVLKEASKLLCGSALFDINIKQSNNNKLNYFGCHGFAVYQQNFFYKISSKGLYTLSQKDIDWESLNGSFVVNTYNSLNSNTRIAYKSDYAAFMHRFCIHTRSAMKLIKVAKRMTRNKNTTLEKLQPLKGSGGFNNNSARHCSAFLDREAMINSYLLKSLTDQKEQKSESRKEIIKFRKVLNNATRLSLNFNISTTLGTTTTTSRLNIRTTTTEPSRSTTVATISFNFLWRGLILETTTLPADLSPHWVGKYLPSK